MNRIIHFEMLIDNPERAIKFYSGVFGWEIKEWEGGDYWLIMTGSEKEPGIDGGMMKKVDFLPPTTNTIEVASIDETIKKITDSGGKIIKPKYTIPGVGYHAYFQDTEGTISGILQSDRNAK